MTSKPMRFIRDLCKTMLLRSAIATVLLVAALTRPLAPAVSGQAAPPPAASMLHVQIVNPPASVEKGEPVTFQAVATTGPNATIQSYSWRFDFTDTAEGQQVTYTFPDAGDYLVGVLATDSAGATGRNYAEVLVSTTSASVPGNAIVAPGDAVSFHSPKEPAAVQPGGGLTPPPSCLPCPGPPNAIVYNDSDQQASISYEESGLRIGVPDGLVVQLSGAGLVGQLPRRPAQSYGCAAIDGSLNEIACGPFPDPPHTVQAHITVADAGATTQTITIPQGESGAMIGPLAPEGAGDVPAIMLQNSSLLQQPATVGWDGTAVTITAQDGFVPVINTGFQSSLPVTNPSNADCAPTNNVSSELTCTPTAAVRARSKSTTTGRASSRAGPQSASPWTIMA